MTHRLTRVIVAGHRGDVDLALSSLADSDPAVRAAALGALERSGALTDHEVVLGLADADAGVRSRAVELAARRPRVALLALLDDPDPDVVEMAAWACGEQLEAVDHPDPVTIARLADLVVEAAEPLVREAAAAALGAIGHPSGLPAILHACADKPHVRRRAVLALAPFDGPEVDAAIERALVDRDWQVRQAAEDLQRATGEHHT